MEHWTPPERRGLYDRPDMHPPPPQPNEANNVVSRLVRIETYLQGKRADAIRMERESWARDLDLADRLRDIEEVTTPVITALGLARWAWASGKFLAFAVVVALWINGAITWQQVSVWAAGALGLPAP